VQGRELNPSTEKKKKRQKILSRKKTMLWYPLFKLLKTKDDPQIIQAKRTKDNLQIIQAIKPKNDLQIIQAKKQR
jgi:23S rRNA A2030 N6-methylase RlmJ